MLLTNHEQFIFVQDATLFHHNNPVENYGSLRMNFDFWVNLESLYDNFFPV